MKPTEEKRLGNIECNSMWGLTINVLQSLHRVWMADSSNLMPLFRFKALKSLTLLGPRTDEDPALFKHQLRCLPACLERLSCGLVREVEVPLGICFSQLL